MENDDIRFGELEPILRRLPSYKRLSDSVSLEWPVNNKLWGLPGVKSMLVDLELGHEAVVRLCRSASHCVGISSARVLSMLL